MGRTESGWNQALSIKDHTDMTVEDGTYDNVSHNRVSKINELTIETLPPQPSCFEISHHFVNVANNPYSQARSERGRRRPWRRRRIRRTRSRGTGKEAEERSDRRGNAEIARPRPRPRVVWRSRSLRVSQRLLKGAGLRFPALHLRNGALEVAVDVVGRLIV